MEVRNTSLSLSLPRSEKRSNGDEASKGK